jgi:hypothetical protein
MSKQKENVIREQRTIEATKKNLMGPAGKFGLILQAFGTPVIRQGSGMFDSSYLDDPYEDFTDTEYSPTVSGQNGPVSYRDEIALADMENIHNEGLLFDGLSRGMHLEIVYWQTESKLQVSYKGYPVYIEIAGELETYAPFDDWENLIERLAKAAKEKLKTIKKAQEEEISEKIQEKKKSFFQNLRLRWGI